MQGVFQKTWSLTRGKLVWGIRTFVTSKAGLTKGVVFQRVVYQRRTTVPECLLSSYS